jgi:hypothetical protein
MRPSNFLSAHCKSYIMFAIFMKRYECYAPVGHSSIITLQSYSVNKNMVDMPNRENMEVGRVAKSILNWTVAFFTVTEVFH